MSLQDDELPTQAHRILRLYEMFFSLMFRFMEEYEVNDLGQLMILTTIAIANANKIDADIETISEETDIPYSTVRRKVEKMCADGILEMRKERQKLVFSISDRMDFAHPAQQQEDIRRKFQKDVVDIVVKSINSIILEKKK
ncbi:hypothetical protein [Stappia sp. TSB10GB4]|uniref:hypothetical protein n=1 Tax=Stappia sp. TSB10GB4 TaxID=2003584 RepID=UPI0016461C3F|nr:hypothetical protein [Stappia sp. TSB10GB4]